MAEPVKIDDRTWRIEEDGVRYFLLEGSKSALLIDTGMESPDARDIAEGLTDLPIRLLNTHVDPDHISGNAAFSEVIMSALEWGAYSQDCPEGMTAQLVGDGDVIDLGGRTLEIIELPGHTVGSIAVLDVERRVLIGGDSIQDGQIFMFGPKRSMAAYIESLQALWDRHADRFDKVYPSHGSIPVTPELIPQLIDAAKSIEAGESDFKQVEFYGQNIAVHSFGFAAFLCNLG